MRGAADPGRARRPLQLRRRGRPTCTARIDVPRPLRRSARSPAPGLHGANRLASNSLLEGAGLRPPRAADASPSARAGARRPQVAALGPRARPAVATRRSSSRQNWDEIRRLMWNYVGIVRTDKRLMRARQRIDLLREEIRDYYWRFLHHPRPLELRNIARSRTSSSTAPAAARRAAACTTPSTTRPTIRTGARHRRRARRRRGPLG